MKIKSLQKSHPTEIEWNGQKIKTSFIKKNAGESLQVFFDHIDGDSFAMPDAHGAINNVVYAISVQAYEEFKTRLNSSDLHYGQIGENLTLSELDENLIFVGDVFEIGDCQIQATFPRTPCTKFNIIFKNPEGQKHFEEMRRPGVYFRVLKEGQVRVGDQLKLIQSDPHQFPMTELYEILVHEKFKFPEKVDQYLAATALPENYKKYILKKTKGLP